MKKKLSFFKTTILLLGGTIIAGSLSTLAVSFSWFTNKDNVTKNFFGKTSGAYFARGDGSKDSPYVINSPIHLYNLAWLQDIGYFKDKECYFVIESNLDMKGWTLPPIGTDQYPFAGHLDGYDLTTSKTGQTLPAKISNLTISNSFSDYSKHPGTIDSFSNEDDGIKQPSKVGLFGVIEASSTSKSSLEDLLIDNLTVKSSASNTLAGLVCGYVGGEISGVYLNNSKLDLGDTSALSGYSCVSKYTSVGYCESAYETSAVKSETTLYKPQYIASTSFDPASGGSGQDADWGGSIDISSLSKRVTFITNYSTLSSGKSTSYPTYTNENFNASFYQSPNQYKWDYSENNSGQYCALQDGCYLPLNINTSNITDAYYKENTSEDILNTNTGYIVGYGERGNASPRVTNKLSNSGSKGIKYSIANQANGADSSDRGTVFTQSNIALFYYDTANGSTNRIKDEYNSNTAFNTKPSGTSTVDLSNLGLAKYSSVKEQFIEMLNSGTSDTNLSAKKITLNGIQIFKLKSENLSTFDASNVKLNGKTYSSYQFYRGGFNFSLQSSGILTMVVGCYTTSEAHQLPQIFKLERDSSNIITSRTEIKTIYKDDSGIYYNDTSKGTTINLEKMTSSEVLLQGCAYYIEVPLNAGDYYFASIDQKNNCPYILYLDIGANAGGDDSGKKVTRTKILELVEQSKVTFSLPTGIYVVDYTDLAYDDLKKKETTFCVQLGSSYKGTAGVKIDDTTATAEVTASTDTGLAYFDPSLTMKVNAEEVSASQIKGVETLTSTKRLTYFDYYKEDESLQVFTIEQTKSGSGDWGSQTAKKFKYSDSALTEDASLKIYGDDGSEVTDLTKISVTDDDGNDPTAADAILGLSTSGNDESTFGFDYLPSSFELDATNLTYTIKGYDVTLSPSEYKLISKSDSYAFNVNGTAI